MVVDTLHATTGIASGALATAALTGNVHTDIVAICSLLTVAFQFFNAWLLNRNRLKTTDGKV
jgi:tetrahydromethanopterin S-methyltransferase subunit D